MGIILKDIEKTLQVVLRHIEESPLLMVYVTRISTMPLQYHHWHMRPDCPRAVYEIILKHIPVRVW